MIARRALPSFEYLKRIDWKLLVFLVLFLNVKLVFKAIALLIIILLQKDLLPGFKWKNSRLPLFYPVILLVAAFNFILYAGYGSTNQTLAFITGCMGWLACMVAIHQVKLFTEKLDAVVIENTLILFFLLNALVSFANLGCIIWETGALNPYRYQGEYQKYFMGTGDFIKGISFDTCTTNALLNAAGIIYFLYRNKYGMVLLCAAVMLLTASNLTNVFLWTILGILLIFRSGRVQKSMMLLVTAMLVIFLAKLSPQNNHYLEEQWEKIANGEKKKESGIQKESGKQNDGEEMRREIAMNYLDSVNRVIREKEAVHQPALLLSMEHSARPELPVDDIHSPPFQNRDDTNAARRTLIAFMNSDALHPQFHPKMPGKLIAMQQTAGFFYRHPAKLVTGAGMGHFSSKLAFRTTLLGMAGGYPSSFTYIDPDFRDNHLALYAWYFSQRARMHSITNLPNSVYDQLVSEYGMMGIMAFLLFYLGFFLKKWKSLSFGLPIILLLCFACLSEYWFEQLSIIPFFELLIFLDLKQELKTEII